MKPLRVLIVDDELAIRRTLERALQRRGYHVLTAASGEAACDMLRLGPVDVVLMDLRMPTMSGQTLYHVILSQWPEIANRVVVMSGDPESGEHEQWLEMYQLPVVAKPFDLAAVYGIVDALLASQRRLANGESS